MEKKIAVIRGDGIGPEIMTQALAVLGYTSAEVAQALKGVTWKLCLWRRSSASA